MRRSFVVPGALIAIGLMLVPVSAAPFAAAASKNLTPQALSDDGSSLVQVQYRRGYGGRGGYRGGRGGGDDGGAIAAGVIGGLLLGAIIANEAQRSRGTSYCAQRYRSYDPGSGTYLGNDGRRHSCR